MKIDPKFRGPRNRSAFAMAEVVCATFVVALIVAGSMSLSYMVRVQDAKNREISVARDFATHYLEMIRGMAFNDVGPGKPINDLYDGAHGGPSIPIPNNSAWFAIDNVTYQSFHPDLLWLTNRALEMRVQYTPLPSAVAPTTKHLRLELRWTPPLNSGAKQQVRFDLLRARDV